MRFTVQQELYTISFFANTRTKLFHALLRAMHAFEIWIHTVSRQVMFLELFQGN